VYEESRKAFKVKAAFTVSKVLATACKTFELDQNRCLHIQASVTSRLLTFYHSCYLEIWPDSDDEDERPMRVSFGDKLWDSGIRENTTLHLIQEEDED
jgi:hypothetical protein